MASSPDRHAPAVLPIPDRPPFGLTTSDAKDLDTAFPPIEPLVPPAGAPSVLIVLIDDVGFSASSAFSGPCNTPNAKRLAAGGLKFNLGDDDHDHFIDPEERLRIAMAPAVGAR